MALDDARYPWPVEIAALLCDDELKVRSTLHVIVTPPVSIPVEASNIHGITDEVAGRFGIPPRGALGAFVRLLSLADVVVAHNVDFDADILRSAAQRSGVPMPRALPSSRCTAKAAAPVLNLPPTPRMVEAGMSEPKTPNLGESVEALCGRAHVGAHTALADAMACLDVYAALLARGCWAQERRTA
jgi:DNA polymerase-3 subunit epsilon